MKQFNTKYQSENFNTSNLEVTDTQQGKVAHSALICLNHEERRATYIYRSSQNNEQMLYCEKCAIMLASQGFTIVKLDQDTDLNKRNLCGIDESISGRQEEIQKFIDELSNQINEMSFKDSKAEYSLRISEEHFNNLMEQTIRYFQQIQDIIQVQKFITLNAILSQRTELQQEVRLMRTSLLNEVQMLTGFSNDIQNNMQAVESVEETIYESIMDNYRSKLNFSYQFSQLNSDVLRIPKPTTVFPDIPLFLYSLADNIQLRSEQTSKQAISYPQNQQIPRQSLTHRSSKSRTSWENRKSNDHQNYISERRPHSLKPLSKCGNNLGLLRNEQKNGLYVTKSLQTENQGRKNQLVYSQQEVYRDSLRLPEIEQNDKDLQMNTHRRSTNIYLQESIPEQMVNTSHESFPEYYDSDTMGYNLSDANEEAPQTVLIF